MNSFDRHPRALRAACLVALFLATSAEAWAGSSTGAVAVSVALSSSCVVSATNINFTATGLLTSTLGATGTVSVQCTNSTSFSIGINAGSGSGATVANRKMTAAGSTVSYSIYKDSGYASVWGNTVGTDTVGGTANGSPQTMTAYAQVPPQATPAPGSYLDSVNVSVTY